MASRSVDPCMDAGVGSEADLGIDAGIEIGIARRQLFTVYARLFEAYGPQHWWPGETPFEVMVGAVLTQNTAWTNVEKAIAGLKDKGCLDPSAIVAAPIDDLAQCIRPAGYFNVKARCLQGFCAWYLKEGAYDRLSRWKTPALRKALLRVSGIGPETADDILLYAFDRPLFVIDAYTRRLYARLGLAPDSGAGRGPIRGDEDYETLRAYFETRLGPDAPLYNEYHALIVRHAKQVCRKQPRCRQCCLAGICAFERASSL
jgi:endonuclease III related protein